MSQSMGIGQRLKTLFRQSHEIRVNALERAGVFIVKDDNISMRLETLGQLQAIVTGAQSTSERVKYCDMMVDQIAAAWGRGGDLQRYFEAYSAWKLLVGLYYSMCQELQKTDNIRTEDETMMNIFAEKHVIPYAYMIIEAAYKDKDVSPNQPITIQSGMMLPPAKEIPAGGMIMDWDKAKIQQKQLNTESEGEGSA